jgi:hypothetical protein
MVVTHKGVKFPGDAPLKHRALVLESRVCLRKHFSPWPWVRCRRVEHWPRVEPPLGERTGLSVG